MKSEFLKSWDRKLRTAKDLNDRSFLEANDREDLIVRQKLTSGEWLLFVNASKDSGDNFNATICRDSKGVVRWSPFEFSGYEGLESRLAKAPSNNLEAFWKAWDTFGWTTIEESAPKTVKP